MILHELLNIQYEIHNEIRHVNEKNAISIIFIKEIHKIHTNQQVFIVDRYKKLRSRFQADFKSIKITASGLYERLQDFISALTKKFLIKQDDRFYATDEVFFFIYSSESPVSLSADITSLISIRGSFATTDAMLIGKYKSHQNDQSVVVSTKDDFDIQLFKKRKRRSTKDVDKIDFSFAIINFSKIQKVSG